MKDLDGVELYTREEVLALLDKAYKLMGDALDDLPGSMTLGELEAMVNGAMSN